MYTYIQLEMHNVKYLNHKKHDFKISGIDPLVVELLKILNLR